ncbi:MAG: thiamine diphosphokinase [Ruminococcus sp.]|nr:thiamine diphosphokinase [Ruminococcus sp.]
MNRCVIICGAPNADVDFIRQAVDPSDDFVICADSGYAYAEKAGIRPDLFVGDFDSFLGILPEDIPKVTLKTHKDDTDSMHCAAVALERGYREVILLAATGGRLDHTLANISVLQYLTENGAKASILSDREEVFFLPKGRYTLDNVEGKTFSVFPFGCPEVVVTYNCKVEYPVEKLKILSSDTIGVSNIFHDDRAEVVVDSGSAVLIVENRL